MRAGDLVGERFRLLESLVPAQADDVRNVWRAHDERLGREVVLKRVLRHTPTSEPSSGQAPSEPRAMARLNHPHVIAVYEHLPVEEPGDEAVEWAVLEYAPGGSLAGQRLAPQDAARVGAQLAGALAYLHGKGLLHCDLKPANLVLAERGVAKLTDFGSAYRIDPEATITPQNLISYTPGYAAPELIGGHPTPASDVYSLAATVYALVTGSPPSRGSRGRHGRHGNSSLGGPLGEALAEMLRPDPHDRPDATQAGRRFQTIAGTGSPPDQPARQSGSPEVVPAQLPADVYGFAGRAAELERLDHLLADPNESAAVVISAIAGTAGVGKTALAVHWAHRIAGRFPDGQLYVNLRGFDPSGQVMDPADALRGFLAALDVPPERTPADRTAQAALFRSQLDGKRVLVVLDNARDTEQVQDLLPGSSGCLAVVTSRNDLVGLITKQGARPLDLEVLTDADARQLLERRLGRDRTQADGEAVDEIVQACAHLPLALAIVAARATIRPRFPLAGLVAELRESHARLDALAGEGPDTDVRAVFSWSYHQLGTGAQRLFRLLGLHPGPDLSTPAAASLAGLPPAAVRSLLADLTRAHLLAEPTPGRYTFHDLLREYATELAHTDDSEADRHAATLRMLDHYMHTAYTADGFINPGEDPPPPTPPRAGVTPEQPRDYDQAVAWFTAEHPVLLAMLDHADKGGFDTHAWYLALDLGVALSLLRHLHDLVASWHVGMAAARRRNDRPAQAQAHRNLARAHLELGQFDDAHHHLQESLDLDGELGNLAGQAGAYSTLGSVLLQQGRHDAGLEHKQRSLDLYRQLDDRFGQAVALNGLGWNRAEAGDHQLALTYSRQALDLFQETGRRNGEAATWDSIGYSHHHLGQYDEAVACYQRSLELYRELQVRNVEAVVLVHLGDAEYALGDQEASRASWERALGIFEELELADADAVRTKLERLDRPPPTAQPETP